MSNLQYDFLSYEEFPDDQYVKAVVEVCFNGIIVIPYQKVVMKDGGSFWGFPGVGATKNGVKKRFNGSFDSRSVKIKFEQDLDAFVKSGGVATQGQIKSVESVAVPNNANLGHSKSNVGEPDWSNPPF